MRSCVSCANIDSCPDVDEQKLVDKYVCVRFYPADSQDIKARLEIIDEFGEWALPYANSRHVVESKPTDRSNLQRRRKKNGG